ncbi:Membrane-bound metallopeptidase [Thalassovita gelatinovora]|uniref:Membrane-bound metallopeptidase n=1 Tax=Thalassovita gelatinovora TaxID=53501 RepID=A0A0P1F955_THAGE|nr:peptidoglycan DD-metalloendopeptidase family protein [Thalassovita gelatinovora]QIZ81208.1 peptidoglycan DD-metalloendopeptidase family protein [Thalassovita gelatinovora]CUH64707.1 Membrane-bound metallopeptidase [Thalassovita gelatinovora]SEP93335.1 Septal ring factor EnvC, activator of murein hydrolases AmiA and AmiB [Thalassovita gelatinovora]
MIRAALIALCIGIALPACADPDPAALAEAAAKRLETAAMELDRADSARNRVKALSETLRAYEDGLEAMREGLRRVTLREAELAQVLQARETEIAQLLGVLQSISATPAPVLVLHPDGPTGTARSGMLLADVTPALNEQAARLRTQLDEVSTLRSLQQNAVATLEKGLDGVQQARTRLSQAVADRTDLPRRFTEDPVKTAILIASTETLTGFASGLTDIADNESPGSLPDIAHRKGVLPLPVQSVVLRRAGEADATGITRPGLILATRPRALVSTPSAATIRYQGPLLDYGNVMILEPQAGLLFIFAGLDVVYGITGQVLPAGSPIGLMGGEDAEIGAILAQAGKGAGAEATETLYIEIREDNAPVDPATWFVTGKDN